MRHTVIFFIFMSAIALFGCKKQESEIITPKISDDNLEVTATSATFRWTVDWPGKIISVVEVSENEDMSNSRYYGTEEETENHNFTVTVEDLTGGKKYFYRLMVWNKHYVNNKFEMEVKSFTTETDLPKVKVLEVTDITRTSALCQGEIVSDGGLEITERGICWSTSHNPTTNGSHSASSQNTTIYSVLMNNLTPGETYYVRGYARNANGTAYSEEEKWFVTGDAVPPTVTTVQVTDISWRTAIGGGEVNDDGDAMVTERGVCWSTSENPTVENSHSNSGTGTDSFTINITGLTAGTTYHVRAYAKNRAGYGYGGNVTFKTSIAVAPTVTTAADPTDITRTAAVCGGNVINDGGDDITERGVCWSTVSNPSISGNHLAVTENSIGGFTVQITGLTPNTSYYVCGYATNSVGTSYGTPKSFATLPIGKPTVTTAQVSNITTTTATCGGNVTDDGGAEVTERGICWSTEHNPTLENCIGNAHSGTGTGTFALNMTGLTHGTKYYVSAYATNSAGTTYGSEVNFTTSTIPSYTISVSASPMSGGSVSGGGTYQQGQSCTVSAMANSDFTFTNWTENGNVVSTNATYTFTVNGNRNFVANFSTSAPIYTIVNSTLQLEAGEHYILVGYDNDGQAFAMGYQKTNNRHALIISEVGGVITATVANNTLQQDAPYEFILGGSPGAWTFYDPLNNGYLYAPDGGNFLRTQAELTNSGRWTIIDGDGGGMVPVSIGGAERCCMRYSIVSTLFGCYKESSTVVAHIYFFKANGM